jgi:hypothetical protein
VRARMWGLRLRWSLGWGTIIFYEKKISLPRGIWTVNLPLEDPRAKSIRRAGFTTEYIGCLVLLCLSLLGVVPVSLAVGFVLVTCAHRIMYPHYAEKESDLI